MSNKHTHITLWALAALVACPLALSAYKSNNNGAIARNLDTFASMFKELNAFYVDTINPQARIETAINAMLQEIDPYTEYIPAQDHDDFQVVSTGEYGGIGSYIVQRDGFVYFSEPSAGSPAARAGIWAGDKIVRIDTTDVAGWSSQSVSQRLKGSAGTRLTVTVERPYCADSVKVFGLTREKIKVNPVPYYGVARGHIAYINISTFNEKTGEAVREALLRLKADPCVDCIALDVRGNGGGLIEQAVKVVGLFVPKGTEVVQTRGRQSSDTKIYKTSSTPVDTRTPLFVLTDGGSASASEIVTGALQDLDRAVVVGDRTYGKGLVQTTRTLPYGNMLKVTIAKYYIPSGRLIQEIDYSHRDAEGNAIRVPDSLTSVFHTANGREVRDGGGITPDIKVKLPRATRLTYNIARDYWAYDFATQYHAQHPVVAAAADFVVTDSIFAAFKRFIRPDKFKYDRVCESGISQLRDIAGQEGYMTDSVKAQFDILAGMLKHDLMRDLDTHRPEIERLLRNEMMRHYYYAAGDIENSLRDDENLNEVDTVMATAGRYARLLSAPAAAPVAGKAKKR